MVSIDDELDPWEVLDVVTRRTEFIACLRDAPKHQSDIQDELSLARSTVYKALRELEELLLIERTEEGYTTSLMGQLLLKEQERFQSNIENICHLGPLLSLMPTNATICPAVLNDATFVFAERHAPNRPLLSIERFIRETTVLSSFSPVVPPRYGELFHTQLLTGELCANLILEQPVIEILHSDYQETFDETLQLKNTAIHAVDEQLPFGLFIAEQPTTRIGISVYDTRGSLLGFIENSSEEAFAWGQSLWNRYQHQAVELTTDHSTDSPLKEFQ